MQFLIKTRDSRSYAIYLFLINKLQSLSEEGRGGTLFIYLFIPRKWGLIAVYSAFTCGICTPLYF